MRIQAVHLSESDRDTDWTAALELVSRLLGHYPDALCDLPVAHDVAARCHERLGRIELALEHYRMSIARQQVLGKVRTGAALHFSHLVARHGIRSAFDEALKALDAHDSSCLGLPIERFLSHASRARIAAHRGERELASQLARHALDAAAQQHSGLAHKPDLGLVGAEHVATIRTLESLLDR